MLTLKKGRKLCSLCILWVVRGVLGKTLLFPWMSTSSPCQLFFLSKRAADTSVNAYLSIYFAYTPFYGSLTLYEWVPLSKSVQLHSLHCTEAKLYKRTKSRPSPPAHEFIEIEQHQFGSCYLQNFYNLLNPFNIM